MSLDVDGFDQLIARLTNIEQRIPNQIGAHLAHTAVEIQALAKKFVPELFTGLMEAIKVKIVPGQGRDWRGRFTYKVAEVYVDNQAPSFGRDGQQRIVKEHGVVVGEYAYWIHEDLTYGLGFRSYEKMSQSGLEVGPKFLSRAVQEVGEKSIAGLFSTLKL